MQQRIDRATTGGWAPACGPSSAAISGPRPRRRRRTRSSLSATTSTCADRSGGDAIDVLTDTAPLVAGVPYRYTPASGSSEHPYAHIDEIVCHAM